MWDVSSVILQVTEAHQRVSVEKEQVSEQYKHYMEQLQAQNSQLTVQVGVQMIKKKLNNILWF